MKRVLKDAEELRKMHAAVARARIGHSVDADAAARLFNRWHGGNRPFVTRGDLVATAMQLWPNTTHADLGNITDSQFIALSAALKAGSNYDTHQAFTTSHIRHSLHCTSGNHYIAHQAFTTSHIRHSLHCTSGIHIIAHQAFNTLHIRHSQHCTSGIHYIAYQASTARLTLTMLHIRHCYLVWEWVHQWILYSQLQTPTYSLQECEAMRPGRL